MIIKSSQDYIDIDDNIHLEILNLNHYYDLKDLFFSEEVSKTYMIPNIKNEDDYQKLFDILLNRSIKDRYFLFAIIKDNKAIGIIHTLGEVNLDKEVEIGYAINPKYKGNGYATSALKAIINHLFSLGVKSIICSYFEGNYASKRVMEKTHLKETSENEIVEYNNEKIVCNIMRLTNEILLNVDKIHTTSMGLDRLKKNTSLEGNIVDFVIDSIKNYKALYRVESKNVYIVIDNMTYTINRTSYTIITAHRN